MKIINLLKMKKNINSMIKGYKKMAILNTELAEEGLCVDNEALRRIELNLAESEQIDSKTRGYILR
ncbi:MAG: hypothetical protein E7480_02840 [Ruminococcaceae bacterium]|nr:hypothetical protein [Oscillospiraceae bacterium]